MEAKELRIGNLYYGCSRGEVETVVAETILAKQNTNLCMNPIPLTEEWLLRFDFHRHHADYSNGYIMLKNVPFEKDGFTFKLFPKELGGAEEPMEAQKIKYVHQLQNLYFAIIGSELTIDF